MSEEFIEEAVVVDDAKEKEEPMEIEVDGQTAYNMKVLEFDKNIAEAKALASKLEHDKITFIYQTAINSITQKHKEDLIKKQVEEESKRRLVNGI